MLTTPASPRLDGQTATQARPRVPLEARVIDGLRTAKAQAVAREAHARAMHTQMKRMGIKTKRIESDHVCAGPFFLSSPRRVALASEPADALSAQELTELPFHAHDSASRAQMLGLVHLGQRVEHWCRTHGLEAPTFALTSELWEDPDGPAHGRWPLSGFYCSTRLVPKGKAPARPETPSDDSSDLACLASLMPDSVSPPTDDASDLASWSHLLPEDAIA
jgi:hypothetical protein